MFISWCSLRDWHCCPKHGFLGLASFNLLSQKQQLQGIQMIEGVARDPSAFGLNPNLMATPMFKGILFGLVMVCLQTCYASFSKTSIVASSTYRRRTGDCSETAAFRKPLLQMIFLTIFQKECFLFGEYYEGKGTLQSAPSPEWLAAMG
jgi:hypothetical protein